MTARAAALPPLASKVRAALQSAATRLFPTLAEPHPDAVALAKSVLPSAESILPTGTRLDAGTWIPPVPAHIAWNARTLAVVEPGRSPVAHLWDGPELSSAFYNHATGCLVLPPSGGRAALPLKLEPAKAFALLHQINPDNP